MGRPTRVDAGGQIYHLYNRASGRRKLFAREDDYLTFEQTLFEAVEHAEGKVQLLAYVVMPDHFRIVARTTKDGVLSPFMQWLTLTHTQRYQANRKKVGDGPIYQGRYRSFLIQPGSALLDVCQYVEGEPAREGVAAKAEDWLYSSLWLVVHGEKDQKAVLSDWPGMKGRPRNWTRTANKALDKTTLAALDNSTQRGAPYGEDKWRDRMVVKHNLLSTIRSPGRPRKNG